MDPIYHFLIPVLILLAARADKKLVFLLAPLSIIPDFDGLTVTMHRALFHNIFFAVILLAVLYLIIKKFYKTKFASFLFVASTMFFSHLLLDFDSYGIAFFFPLDKHAYTANLTKVELGEFHLTLNSFLYLQLTVISILQLLFLSKVFQFKKFNCLTKL